MEFDESEEEFEDDDGSEEIADDGDAWASGGWW